jgi:beta-lactamase class D
MRTPKAEAARGLVSLVMAAALGLASCAPPARDRIDQDRLNADIDQSFGGLGTCAVILDTQTGRENYRYGRPSACTQALPPCETFQPVAALIGLDAALITPQTVLKWDGSPQPTKAWETDADLAKAFHASIGWWFGRLSELIGRERYVRRLADFRYAGKPDGPITSFWQGPAHGGGTALSATAQADFARRMFAGKLPVKPETLAAVLAVMQTDPHGTATMTSIAGSCSDVADQSRGVGWFVGRLKTPDRDLTFAAVVEAAAPPPGSVIGDDLKAAFADVRLWPAGE